MKKTFIIGDRADVMGNLHAYLDGLDADMRYKVTIEPYKANRSAAQQRLQWLWNTEIGIYRGHTKDETHDDMKERFAVPILIRDDADYAAMVTAVRDVRKAGMAAQADRLKREIVRLTSTTVFSTAQMAEYLTDMEHFAADIGAPLSFPGDLVHEAMGRGGAHG